MTQLFPLIQQRKAFPSAHTEKTRLEPVFAMYDIIEEIGSGGFGTVYKVKLRKSGQILAMKKFTRKDGSREIEKLKKLKHPNIVAYAGSIELPDEHCVFVEYCSRGNLNDFRGNPSNIYFVSNIIDWGEGLFSALEYLRQQEIQHRDVKPQNIVLDDDYHLKLCDFGVSKSDDTKGVTGSTARYCPPEDDGDPRGDIYSAGLVLWEMIERKIVFDSHRGHFYTNLNLEPPQCRQELAELVSSCTCKQIEQRCTAIEALKICTSLKKKHYYIMHQREPAQLEHVANCSSECKNAKRRPFGVLNDVAPMPEKITCEWIAASDDLSIQTSFSKRVESDDFQRADTTLQLGFEMTDTLTFDYPFQSTLEDTNTRMEETGHDLSEEVTKMKEALLKGNERSVVHEEQLMNTSLLENRIGDPPAVDQFLAKQEYIGIEIQQDSEECSKTESAEKLQEVLKKPVYLQRLTERGCWTITPATINRLNISVTKPMYLCEVVVYLSISQSSAQFTLRISGKCTEVLKFRASSSGLTYTSIELTRPVQLMPGCKYLLELSVDKDVEVFCGSDGRSRLELPNHPGYEVQFSNCEGSETTVENGQFEGFYFAPIP